MMSGICRSLKGCPLSRDERESMVAQAFLEGALRLKLEPGSSFVAPNLKCLTWKAVHRLIRGELEYANHEQVTEDDTIEATLQEQGGVDRGPGHFADQLAVSSPELRATLTRWLGSAVPSEDVELVSATVLSGKEVREYVRERVADRSPTTLRREEDRARQAIRRATRRIREGLQARFARDRHYAGADPIVG